MLKDLCKDFWLLVAVLVVAMLCIAVCTRVARAHTPSDEDMFDLLKENSMWDLSPHKPETWTPPSFRRERRAPKWNPMEVERPDWRKPNIDGCFIFLDCNER